MVWKFLIIFDEGGVKVSFCIGTANFVGGAGPCGPQGGLEILPRGWWEPQRAVGRGGAGPDSDFDRFSLAAMWSSGLKEAVEIMHINPWQVLNTQSLNSHIINMSYAACPLQMNNCFEPYVFLSIKWKVRTLVTFPGQMRARMRVR